LTEEFVQRNTGECGMYILVMISWTNN